MIVTPESMPTNSSRWVGSVPSDAGTGFCRASEPARPRTNTIGRKRPSSITTPSTLLYQAVFTEIPANALPLLFAAEVNAYNTSDRPCGPLLSMLARSPGNAIASAVPTSTRVGVVSRYSEANFTSRPPSFLPRYSGVRPTISPAMKTLNTAKINMP